MSHFEYVSIAVALIYALVIGRLLTGLGPSIEERRRYPIQIAWIVTLFLVCIFSWWQLWTTREVEWTALRFAISEEAKEEDALCILLMHQHFTVWSSS